MMSVKNDQPPPTATPAPNNLQTPFIKNPRPEEIKAYKDCLSSLYFKGGLPYALLMESIRYYKPPAKPRTLMQRGLGFMGNVLLGTFLFTPVCYFKMLQMHQEFEEQEKRKEKPNIFPVTEDTQPVTRVEDFSYPADLITNLSEPETNFSSDFSSSTIVYDDEKDFKTAGTTYEDLRAQNRRNLAYEPPVSALTSEFSQAPSSNTLPVNKAPTQPSPSRRVVKNKYGDEIE